MNKFTLAYCSDNALTAKEIDQQLSGSGFEFQHVSCEPNLNDTFLGEQIPEDQMIILLVSDNLLKSTACMYNALPMIQRLSSEARVISLIIDGKYKEADGSIKSVPTNFDRVSHVIQYMNFWQDEYLELRKKKKQIPAEQQERYESQLKVIRNISSEIGEFLRILRSVEAYSFDNFKANNYKVFYYKTGNQSKHKELVVPQEELALKQDSHSVSTPVAPFTEIKEVAPELNVNKASSTESPTTELVDPELESLAEPTKEIEQTIEVEDQQHEDEHKDEEKNELLERIVAHRKEQEPKEANEIEDHLNKVVDEVLEEEAAEEDDEMEENDNRELSTEEILQSIFDDEEEEDDEDFEEETEEVEGNTPYENIEEIEGSDFDTATESTSFSNLGPQKSLSDTEESIYEASRFAEAGDLDRALGILSELLQDNPENTDVRYQYAALIDEYADDQERVTQELNTILEYDTDHIEANLKLANIAEQNKDYLAAKNLYEKVVQQTDEYPEIYYKLGLITSKHFVGQKEKAARYFKKAIKLDKSNSDIYYQYAVLLNESLNKSEKSIKHFKNCIALQPDHPFAHYDLALIYYKMGKYKKAKKHYQLACQNNAELKTEANDLAFENPPLNEKLTKNALDATMEEDQEIELMEEILPTQATQEVEEIIEESVEEEEREEFIEEEIIEIEEEAIEASPIPEKLSDVVLITGASSGIGKATSTIFAQRGYNLILTGRRADRLEELKTEFETQYNIQVQTLSFDVRNLDAVKENIDNLPDAWKQIDILINNAGLAKGFAPIHEGSLEHWETMIDTNIKGLLYLTRAISPYMVERRQGHIINVGSTAGKEVYPNGNVYCATKFAVDALTKSMRLDLHKHNIRVSQVSPGHVEETEFALVRFDGDQQRAKIYEDFQPLKSKDVAEVIYFMATRPAHVNIQDVLLMGTQQAGNNHIDRSGRND